MKRVHLVMVAAAAVLSSCSMNAVGFGVNNVKPTGKEETKTFKWQRGFDKLETSAGVNVVYVPSASATQTVVTVKTDQAMMGHVKVEHADGDLNIYRENGVNSNGIKINVTVTGPVMREYEASAGASISISDALAVKGKASFEVSSGASMNVSSVTAGKIDVEASSGAAIKVGSAVAGKVEVEASSGATASVVGIQGARVKAEASSGASVTVAGRATGIDVDRSSGGSVNRDGLTLER